MKCSLRNQKRFTLRNSKGFTLVEILVVVLIFAVVSSILLFRYSDFSTAITLRNLSQEVALSIRKAQTLATSVRGGSPRNAFNTTKGYGIYIRITNNEAQYSGGSASFVLFRDDDNDGLYDQISRRCGVVTRGNECLENFSITTGDRIYSVCSVSGCTTTPTLIIYFKRPNPDAKIYFVSDPTRELSWVDIRLISKKGVDALMSAANTTALNSNKGFSKIVRVWNTGQIGVLP